ncbi:DEAD/DEAH box helicase [Solicola gregarius]|uniref:DEAD/DEAH box helicase n=1 Tax=Solicola gregarius TaxID=2908642 RepID=A0AA46YK60_9ACTN|nr:DEAD/DEAH box helicase [Solicola gregarius]UYM03673.1 DEAD/DEAH box helicase [Solicola gregarius]
MTLQHSTMPISESGSPGFADLGVRDEIVSALTAQGIESAFPIQAATLPDSLAGRDVLGRGRTGSGKTIAFAIPTLSTLAGSGRRRRPGTPRALVLVPTRELAAQVAAAVVPLATSLGLRSMTVYGGVSQGPQVSKLKAGVDVCIATPGRLEDLIGQGHCRLSEVEVTVLDEADHMADLGFLPAVKRLLDQTPRSAQRLLFSATLDNGIQTLVKRYLTNPVTHSVDSETSHVPEMEHHAFVVDRNHKSEVVRKLVAGRGRTLAFTRTKHGARALARKLTAAGIPAVDLHGNLSQGARQRNLEAFGSGTARVLVATDIAARGIHVDDVSLVVHVDPPSEHKAYLHRSGRTARAGAKGRVVTVVTHDQRRDVRQLMRRASIDPVVVSVVPDSADIVELTGPPADQVDPATVAVRVPSGSNGGGRNRNRGNRRRRSSQRSGSRRG